MRQNPPPMGLLRQLRVDLAELEQMAAKECRKMRDQRIGRMEMIVE